MKNDKPKHPQANRPESVHQPRTKRLREVEELMINGLGTAEISELIMDKFKVCKGTVYNDVSAVRKRWELAVTVTGVENGREKYLASLESVRRKALTGWMEGSGAAAKVRGRDFKLVHDIDKEIARFSGIDLKIDTKSIHLTVEKARDYLDKIMEVVFSHVTDPEMQAKILEDFAKLDEGE